MADDRDLDVLLLGATGFTGGLVARRLAEEMGGRQGRWGVAGRRPGALREVLDGLADVDGAAASEPEVVEVDVTDDASLRRAAGRARVLATTVGPYARLGRPVVDACVAEGTHYADITGEPAFVEGLLREVHDDAVAAGVRVVNACGFDSVPHDLGALVTVRELPDDRPVELQGYVSADGRFSGGTLASALGAFAELGPRDLLGGLGGGSGSSTGAREGGRRVRAVRPSVRRVPEVRGWGVPMPTIDPVVVMRSARELEEYGPDFRYGHNLRLGNPVAAAGLGAGLGGVVALAQLGPTRSLLERLVPSGSGPDAERRARSWFRVTMLGRTTDDGPEVKVRGEVRGGDPGYDETSAMLAHSALAMAHDDDLPDAAGVLTPAVGLGDALLRRLREHGMTFEVHDGWDDRSSA